MIKLNKDIHKRSSTYANSITLAVAGAMVYIPDAIPEPYGDWLMLACAILVGLCQGLNKNAK